MAMQADGTGFARSVTDVNNVPAVLAAVPFSGIRAPASAVSGCESV